MFLLLLTLFFIAGSLGIALPRNFEKPLHTINASLFLSLFLVIYSHHLSSLLLGSLNLDSLLITAISITFLFVVCFTKFFTKLSLPSFDQSSIEDIFKGKNLPPTIPHPHSCKHLHFSLGYSKLVRLWIRWIFIPYLCHGLV